jgi:hypothetical protein
MDLDLGAALAVAVDPAGDVIDYLRAATIPADQLVTITPAEARMTSSRRADQVIAYVQQIKDLGRADWDGIPTSSTFTSSSPGAETWPFWSAIDGTALVRPSSTNTLAPAAATPPALPVHS